MIEENNNRRPIRSRNARWAHQAATWLKNKGITPNTISLCSIPCAAIAAIAFLLVFHHHTAFSLLFFVLAIMGMQARLICNLLDGMVAIEGGLKSAVGPVY